MCVCQSVCLSVCPSLRVSVCLCVRVRVGTWKVELGARPFSVMRRFQLEQYGSRNRWVYIIVVLTARATITNELD